MTAEILAKINNNGMSVNKIITIAHEINDMKDIGVREWAINSFINELKYFNTDTVSYVDGTICNDYINWDSNCGCSIVHASIDLKAIADYLIEIDLEPTLDNAGDALCNLGERIEYWTDVIDDDIYEINIDALIELMSMDNKNKGKAEFVVDFNEYKRKMDNSTEMESNYHMLKTFKYNPKNFGFCTGEEVEQIEKHFRIKDRSNVDLQNLRDFVVMYYATKTESARENNKDEYYFALTDTMSAITGVIDQNKYERGMEI